MNKLTTINIRSIQHYLYCPRRFGLLEIENDWQENAFVIKANLLHERVHDGSHSYSDHKKIVRSSVSLYNDSPEYDLYGIADCIEFIKSSEGIEIPNMNGTFKVQIIEYKPKAPKNQSFNQTDAIQVFAQKICADYVWKTNCDCFLYYCDTKKRVKIPFNELYNEYNEMLKTLLCQMRDILKSTKIPPIRKGQKCSGCSLKDVCFPKSAKYTIKDEIGRILECD